MPTKTWSIGAIRIARQHAKLIAALCLSFIAVTFATGDDTTTPAHDPRVFRIEVKGVNGTSKGRVLTGFRVAGVKGIVTALHGVADARKIDAVNRTMTLTQLKIIKVDVARDLALIGSAELSSKPDAGFTLAETTPPANTEIQIIGYPYGMSQSPSRYPIRRPRVKLEEILPQTDEGDGIRKRMSPKVTQEVVDLQAVIVSGLSGAPLMRSDKVFAVADGSLEGGTTNYVWAIPLNSNILAGLTPYSEVVKRVVEALPSASALDGLDADLPPVLPFTDIKDEKPGDGGTFIGDKHYAKTTLKIDETGKLTSETWIKNDDPADGFCVWPMIAFFDENGQLIHTSKRGSAFCVGSVIEVRAKRALGMPAELERKESHEDKIPLEVLARTHKIAIIHERGMKDPFKRITVDVVFAHAVQEAAKVIPRL